MPYKTGKFETCPVNGRQSLLHRPTQDLRGNIQGPKGLFAWSQEMFRCVRPLSLDRGPLLPPVAVSLKRAHWFGTPGLGMIQKYLAPSAVHPGTLQLTIDYS